MRYLRRRAALSDRDALGALERMSLRAGPPTPALHGTALRGSAASAPHDQVRPDTTKVLPNLTRTAS